MKVSRLALLPANPDILEGVDDLIQLSYLNEPSVLYNLKSRYTQDLIYSKAGPVLIALNPFKDVQIYRSEYVEAYKQRCNDNPHVYAVADAAYNEMIRDEVNQSIIISGEMHQKKQEQMHQKEQGQQQQEYQFQQQHQSLEPEPVMIILGFIILAIKAGNLQFPSQALSLSQKLQSILLNETSMEVLLGPCNVAHVTQKYLRCNWFE
ncbi:myosin-1 isoform X2 [Arachis ipaensis]|uniref:myosin-1 isoform X2 n=1 Tax=Arachis ipaensis TaxID=130454 RepID=UPI0007AFCD10|nr:myosin-1 isoform X2 [Arachis ipaensis]XP_016182024.1 myosin-1 isoform X2 [Arachis ipaensis]XP_020968960.1 myosin-1 isoform X2 [Arachis ipaensis]XP_020968961.1 myosin-1 isoform X2 [Arachis ipaensis]XP_020968962.1 myosin-1 isoform X2 [Arachis ipaensis]XP_020968963.1 myosin-1 isoform X2 [Arachis ipaensis]XP_020968964.1 myosin-1 isoform X2 [Arachis ipaensis]XP_025682597.1 myosin-1 isoform X2 [Arachis hypogaea]XP_025682598.1 myosin-1 isoform X2 [Arachis hypogaea]XP_025682599.1 myosin-1 isofo